MPTVKDWVRSDIAWSWMKANGYETFREHDALVDGVDSGTITEEQLFSEDGYNFPPMPEGWRSVEEIQAEADEEMKKKMIEQGIDPSVFEKDPKFVIVTNDDEKQSEKG